MLNTDRTPIGQLYAGQFPRIEVALTPCLARIRLTLSGNEIRFVVQRSASVGLILTIFLVSYETLFCFACSYCFLNLFIFV